MFLLVINLNSFLKIIIKFYLFRVARLLAHCHLVLLPVLLMIQLKHLSGKSSINLYVYSLISNDLFCHFSICSFYNLISLCQKDIVFPLLLECYS